MKQHGIPSLAPEEIERRSFAIITEELGGMEFPPEIEPVVKRVIHTTADFDYARNLHFSPGAAAAGIEALRSGSPIVTDTRMARSGISKAACARFGCEVHCHIGDPDVAEAALAAGTTRARAAADKAAELHGSAVYAVGNAPTALIRLYELIQEGRLQPRLVIAVPVGFVNVVESKELIVQCGVPVIAAMGRKGGSNVAAAVCNALLYQA